MTFDFDQEMNRIHQDLKALHAVIDRNPDELRRAVDFGGKCQDFVERLQNLLADVPVQLPPPKTQHHIDVDEQTLHPAPRRNLIGRWFGRAEELPSPVDANGMYYVERRRVRIIELPEPMPPGSGPRSFQVSVRVPVVHQQECDEEPGFLYEQIAEDRSVTINVPAVPDGGPYTAAQQAWVDRHDELSREVRDMTTFLKKYEQEIGEVQSATAELRRETSILEGQVKQMKLPVDITPRMDGILKDLARIRQEVPSVEQTIHHAREELEKIRKSFTDIDDTWKP